MSCRFCIGFVAMHLVSSWFLHEFDLLTSKYNQFIYISVSKHNKVVNLVKFTLAVHNFSGHNHGWTDASTHRLSSTVLTRDVLSLFFAGLRLLIPALKNEDSDSDSRTSCVIY